MEKKKNMLLMVAGILMIIGGGLSTVLGLLAVLGAGLLGSGALVFAAILYLISGVISLVAGIMGAKNAAKPEKAMQCIIFGGLVIALSLLRTILNMAGGAAFDVFGLILGLALPAVYMIGALQSKKLAD